ncbi:577_t:CDS:10 [Gigaspora rosea]|nr:577_t:CDS:10 [Gigaspora rosea]
MVEYNVAKVSDIGDGQHKEFTVGGNIRILLARVNGQIHATSHKCTHYGASLATGVLSSDGRITWQGNFQDAPGLDNLQKYKVTIKGDDVYVEAEEDAFKISRRPPKCSAGVVPLNDHTVVIIGGGASGNAAAEKLREDGYNGKIIIISREPYLPIDRPKLSKAFGTKLDKIQIRNKEFYDSLFITFKLGTSVTKVDANSKTVTLDNGENLKYDSLIIATGASPRSIPIPGVGLNNVLYLRTFEDYEKIEQAIGKEEKKNLAIIGSSFIGMEMAAICAKKANVSVIGMEKVPFERVLGIEVGGAIQKLHEASGVSFYLQSGVKEIKPLDTDPNRGGAVILTDERKIPADVIVIGAGVAPATEFLKGSPGFTLEKDGSLKVDENFKVEGLDDVFAIGKLTFKYIKYMRQFLLTTSDSKGDIARFSYHKTGESIRIEHWSFAENTGRAVAGIIAKKPPIPFKKIPYFWSNQLGKGIRYAGYASSFDDVIIQGSLEEFKFAAYYARDDKILAVATISKDPLASHSSELAWFISIGN